MVRCDAQGIYHGHSGGITMYDLDAGRQIWHQATNGDVLFGWQETDSVYGGTSRKIIHRLSKRGEMQTSYRCNAAVYSCATAPWGAYVFAGDSSSSLYCFSAKGQELWKLGTGCGSALSMQFCQDRLYIVTTEGFLACIDTTETAIKAAQNGQLPQTAIIKSPKTVPVTASATDLETTSDSSQGIILECIERENKLRIRVVSPGYNPEWFVQFPRNLRQKGARYLVPEVRESARGGFYRAYGEIKRLG